MKYKYYSIPRSCGLFCIFGVPPHTSIYACIMNSYGNTDVEKRKIPTALII